VTTHILFDFFGTLVQYSSSRTVQGYEQSFDLLREAGLALAYEEFLALWVSVSSEFDMAAEHSHQEFSMAQLGSAFLMRALGQAPDSLVRAFVDTYLAEWNKGVHYPTGVRELLQRLARGFTLAVVTNTHDRDLVPRHLEQMGVSDLFELVVTSVEHGKRKPSPEIFHHTLRVLGAAPASCIHVGDDFEADYRGARSAGLRALLIDPLEEAPIPADSRLPSIFDLEARLSGLSS
jgi:putative hydrolase of the HAD superfamily